MCLSVYCLTFRQALVHTHTHAHTHTHRDVRIPPPNITTSGDLSSIHSRSQEILPYAAHFDHTHPVTGGGMYDVREGSQSDINVGGYGSSNVRRGSLGSNSGVPPPVHGRSSYQVKYSSNNIILLKILRGHVLAIATI